MQAIETKFLPATNTRGSRIKASCERGSISIPYPHELNQEGAHVAAADALVQRFVLQDAEAYGTPPEKNPWLERRVCGGTKAGYAHVFSPAPSPIVKLTHHGEVDIRQFVIPEWDFGTDLEQVAKDLQRELIARLEA